MVKLLGVCTTVESPIAIVMEYVDGGTLSTLLHSEIELPWPLRLGIAEEIIKGIDVLHSHLPQVFIEISFYVGLTRVYRRSFTGTSSQVTF